MIPFGRILPFCDWQSWSGKGKEDREKAGLHIQAKNKKKAPMATKYRVSRKQCTLSVSAPEDYKSSKFRTAPAGVGEYPSRQVMQISPGTVGLFRWHYAGVQFVRCSCGWRLSNIARVSAACKRRPANEGDGSDWLRRFPPFRRPSHFQVSTSASVSLCPRTMYINICGSRGVSFMKRHLAHGACKLKVKMPGARRLCDWFSWWSVSLGGA